MSATPKDMASKAVETERERVVLHNPRTGKELDVDEFAERSLKRWSNVMARLAESEADEQSQKARPSDPDRP